MEQLRSVWYVIEIAAQENTDLCSHAVQVVWFKNASIFDYDKLYDKMHDFEANCWPIRKCSFHICCPQSYIIRILKPTVFAGWIRQAEQECSFILFRRVNSFRFLLTLVFKKGCYRQTWVER
jgi:hypothetical protein